MGRGLESFQVHLDTPLDGGKFLTPIYSGVNLWNELGGFNLLQSTASKFQGLSYFLINLDSDWHNQLVN